MNWSELKDRCYVPYSNKPKVAIVKSKSGNYYPGVRVENISFPLSISAIQVALFSCISEGDEPEELILEPGDEQALTDYWKNEFNIRVHHTDDISDIEFASVFKELELSEEAELKKLLSLAKVDESEFPVSCLVKSDDGYISGVNVEVSSWHLGLCAERVALTKAVANGAQNLQSISLTTKLADFSSPCGACRQVIYELMPYHPIHLFHNDGTSSTLLTVDLLPYHFKSNFLSEKE